VGQFWGTPDLASPARTLRTGRPRRNRAALYRQAVGRHPYLSPGPRISMSLCNHGTCSGRTFRHTDFSAANITASWDRTSTSSRKPAGECGSRVGGNTTTPTKQPASSDGPPSGTGNRSPGRCARHTGRRPVDAVAGSFPGARVVASLPCFVSTSLSFPLSVWPGAEPPLCSRSSLRYPAPRHDIKSSGRA
jgi:hypothetical protein